MATAIDAETWSHEINDVKCSICAHANRYEIADYYCFDCSKHMCKPCLGTHNRYILNHNIVQGLGDGKDVLTEKCRKHADELITLYCRQHDKLLCWKCQLLDHRTCQDLQNIRESSAELNSDPGLQTVPAQLKSALDNINQAIKALDQHVASIQKNGNTFLKDLEDYAKKLLSRIEELREKGMRDVKRKQEELLSITKQHRQACALSIDEIKQCLDKITKSNERKANMFVLKKKGQIIQQKVDALFKESKRLIKGHQFHFKTEMNIFDYLNSFNSLLENVITNVQNISLMSAVGVEVDRPVQATVRMPEEQVVRPERKPAIDIGIQGDTTTCGAKDCCILGDGILVIADGNNRRLKRVEPSSKNVTEYPIDIQPDNQPFSVCCMCPKKTQLAPIFHKQADPDQKDSRLHFLVALGCSQVHEYNAVDMTQTKTIELGHNTCSIACHGDLLYAGSDKTLYVHDLGDGRKLREICKDTDHQDLFSQISGIALNGPGDRVYVADWWKGLVCVSKDGQLQFKLSDEDLKLSLAWGVATDYCGQVFVSGMGSHNVVKVTVTGKKPVAQQILSRDDEIVNPCGLSYDVTRNLLFVGGWNSNKLQMFEMGKSESSRSKTIRKINVRITDDKESCVVSGCCHFNDGSLVIADYINRKLKRVNPSSSEVTKYCDTEEQPKDVCNTGPQEFAVASGYTQVHVYNAVSLTRTRTIELGYENSKTACHGGLLYCAAGRWGINLYVYNVSDGRKLRQFCLKINSLFTPDITGIAVNGSGDRLYVTYWNIGLLCVNKDGRQLFHLSEKDLGLSRATGVTTDHHGHVFVCGQESNNVVKVTEDGHVVGEILSRRDGIERPRCLSYDVSRSQLCLGGKSNQILTVEWK